MSTDSIVILGGSFAGISAAHYALRHVLPRLPKKDGLTYTVTLVNPSKDFFWRVGAPRSIVSAALMPTSKLFYPIEPAFAYAGNKFKLVLGTATHVDATGQTVSVQEASGNQISIPYLALIIATGVSTPSPLFTQTADAHSQEAAYEELRKSLPDLRTVVIGGAGPVGVETAGEIAEALNGKPGFMASGPPNPKAKVTLVCADRKMLPVLRESIAKQAERYLKRLGCNVIYNTKVIGTAPVERKEEGGGTRKTAVQLSDGSTIEADLYIDATGVRPNTSFLPKEWLDTRNRVSTHASTLRVDKAGPRIYALGDCASYTRGGIMDQADAIPVAMTNLRTDLIALLNDHPPGPSRHYKPNLKEQQICPIGTQKGVGAFGGHKVPSKMVWAIKGRDYMVGQLALAYLNGNGFKKEGKWTDNKGVPRQKAAMSSG